MKNRYEEFLKLHHASEPLLIGNVWNVQSAKVFEQGGLKAVATSSAAVAEGIGYGDGQEMGLEAYLFIIKRIAATTSLPLSVDFEAGYGTTSEEIALNMIKLHELGVVGINIEDSVVSQGKRSILSADVFAKKLDGIVKRLKREHIEMFINVRSDTFLLGLTNALEESLVRIEAYQDTGIQGLFFPCIVSIEDISKVTKKTSLPVNVMCMPGLPDFKALKDAGVKRISMGPFLNKSVYRSMAASLEKVVTEGSFKSLF